MSWLRWLGLTSHDLRFLASGCVVLYRVSSPLRLNFLLIHSQRETTDKRVLWSILIHDNCLEHHRVGSFSLRSGVNHIFGWSSPEAGLGDDCLSCKADSVRKRHGNQWYKLKLIQMTWKDWTNCQAGKKWTQKSVASIFKLSTFYSRLPGKLQCLYKESNPRSKRLYKSQKERC